MCAHTLSPSHTLLPPTMSTPPAPTIQHQHLSTPSVRANATLASANDEGTRACNASGEEENERHQEERWDEHNRGGEEILGDNENGGQSSFKDEEGGTAAFQNSTTSRPFKGATALKFGIIWFCEQTPWD
ncbi:hypothetical protein EV702DRAFT_1048168 [Suillus placidus]|uniref:Uncharacterized protein n=1 Tax=Suillus placidus TaxID=48579 RepID=A0A9P7CZD6_9AGAM|nr:hypothetical protein EV702DRAFT_1048168 [Suillus placidus]